MPALPPHWTSLSAAFVHQARRRRTAQAVADSSGTSLTYGELLVRAVALCRVLERELGPEPYVGLCLPPTVAGVVTNIAVSLLGKVPVNLNYSSGQEQVDSAIRQCGIQHVVTARRMLESLKFRPAANLLELEELAARVTLWDRIRALILGRFVPIAVLEKPLPGLRGDRLDATGTVLFTSGATGEPKGVVLSHRNILSNIRQIEVQLEPTPEEAVLGILPFFHAMGFTVTLWAVLCLGRRGVYHPNPLDARIVGRLCKAQGVTFIFATPTFVRLYLRRCDREQLATVRRVALGAEKLKPELADEIRQVFGFDALEGYGTTELSPVVSFNVDREITTPDGRTIAGNRPGTVGQPLPGTSVKTIDPDTKADLPRGSEGLICVRGPQVMAGYLNRPEATASVLKAGWYRTDDLGRVDEDGFVQLGGRLSRFSKIGGEMVSHEQIEAEIRRAAALDNDALAVTAVPDPRRGERLVVLYTDLAGKTPLEVHQALTATAVSRLWIPSVEDFVHVEALPVLGTGKLDLKRLGQMAREQVGH